MQYIPERFKKSLAEKKTVFLNADLNLENSLSFFRLLQKNNAFRNPG